MDVDFSEDKRIDKTQLTRVNLLDRQLNPSFLTDLQ